MIHRFELLDATLNSPILFATSGVIIDSRLSFHKHASSVCQSCYYDMKAFRHIQHSLSFETSSTVARSIVLSRFDYCNSVLYGTSKTNFKKLQNVQNSFSRIVHSLPARSTTQPTLKALHWLPVKKLIIYKIGLLTFKCRNNLAPKYLCELVMKLRAISDSQIIGFPEIDCSLTKD